MPEAQLHVANDYPPGLALLQHHAGVDDVLTRRAPVHEFPGIVRKHRLEGLQQRNDRNRALVELADRRKIKQRCVGILADRIGLVLGNHAELRLRLGKGGFGVEPFLSPVLVRPDLPHFIGAEHRAVNDAVDSGGSHVYFSLGNIHFNEVFPLSSFFNMQALSAGSEIDSQFRQNLF